MVEYTEDGEAGYMSNILRGVRNLQYIAWLKEHPTISSARSSQGGDLFVFVPCPECGAERWVALRKILAKGSMVLCRKCTYSALTKRTMSRNPNWKGGRHPLGKYIRVMVDTNDPFSSMKDKNGYIAEHRLVMARYLNRCLDSSEVVHHINGDRTDNRIENLELIVGRQNHMPYNILQAEIAKLKTEKRELENLLQEQEGTGFITLSDTDYAKAVGQFRLAVGAVLSAFAMYGMDVYIGGAQNEIVQLAEDFGQRVRGIDKPISIEYVRRKGR